jgi:hypothetical protein
MSSFGASPQYARAAMTKRSYEESGAYGEARRYS